MSYTISYGPPVPKAEKRRLSFRMPLLTFLFFCGFLLSVRHFHPETADAVSHLLLPAGGAMEAFSQIVQEGGSFYEAVTAFCQQIVAYASLPMA